MNYFYNFLWEKKKVINFFDGFLYWVILMYVLRTNVSKSF